MTLHDTDKQSTGRVGRRATKATSRGGRGSRGSRRVPLDLQMSLLPGTGPWDSDAVGRLWTPCHVVLLFVQNLDKKPFATTEFLESMGINRQNRI